MTSVCFHFDSRRCAEEASNNCYLIPFLKNYIKSFNASPAIAATNIICGSFIFFDFISIAIVAKAINAVGMSLIVRIAITITEPANAPTTAAVMPSTNALILGCLPYL